MIDFIITEFLPLHFKMAEIFEKLIKIICYMTGQEVRHKKVLPRHLTGSRSRNKKDKAVSFRKYSRKNYRCTTFLSDANVPVRFRAQQRVEYS